MSVVDIRNVKPRKVSAGIEEKLLLSPETVGTKRITTRQLTIDSETRMERKARDETVYYVLSGRGLYRLTHAGSSDWKTAVESDTAIWVPSGMKHSLESTGEGPLVCLEYSLKVD